MLFRAGVSVLLLALAVELGQSNQAATGSVLRLGEDRALRGTGNNCPTGSGILQIRSQSDVFLGTSSMGGLDALRYVCGWTKALVEVPSGWIMRSGPNGQSVNVTIYKKEHRTFPVCCPGYARNEEDICVPKCKGECANGLCTSPGTCECFEGFTLNELGNCVVTCPCGCPYGDCSGNTCVCNPGYALDASGKVCNPLCDMGCEHADCLSPNNCSCHYGYRKRANNNHICLPHCDAPCHNGTCTAPDVCVCNSGYSKLNSKCQPQCTGCKHGKCVAPYTCICHKGYNRVDGKCEPICNTVCVNATCTAPDTCSCFRGYKHSTPAACVPTCFPHCINAECVAPNVCRCNPGYVKKRPHKCVFNFIKTAIEIIGD